MHPLILTCYNRPEHTRIVINELRRYKPEPMYVFVDKSDNKVVQNLVLSEIDWTHPHYWFASRHIGLKRNILYAVNYVFERHETMILLEDDCLPGPYFFEYINMCLDKYADNPKVMSINGYTIPLPETDYPWDVYFNQRIGTWGWATWKRAWKHYQANLPHALSEASDRKIDLTVSGRDIPRIILDSVLGRNDAWSSGWVLGVFLNNGYCVYPTKSHIHNFGFDGSATNARSPQSKWDSAIAHKPPKRLPDDIVIDSRISEHFRRYYG